MGTVPLDRPQGATPEEPSPCLAPAQTKHVTKLEKRLDVHQGVSKIKSGGDLLSQGRTPSTIGSEGLNCRVRDGNGCTPSDIATRNPVCYRLRLAASEAALKCSRTKVRSALSLASSLPDSPLTDWGPVVASPGLARSRTQVLTYRSMLRAFACFFLARLASNRLGACCGFAWLSQILRSLKTVQGRKTFEVWYSGSLFDFTRTSNFEYRTSSIGQALDLLVPVS